MTSIFPRLILSLGLSFTLLTQASTQTFTETTDTGDTITTALNVGAGITMIEGSLPDVYLDVDIYAITLPAVASFSVEVTNFTITDYGAASPSIFEPDSILYIFNPDSAGLVGDDDRSIPPDPIDLLSTATTGPLAAGTYYVAVSARGHVAADAEGDRWNSWEDPASTDFDTLASFEIEDNFVSILGGPPLPANRPAVDYLLTLNTETVPEPSSALLLLSAAGLLAARRRR